MVYHIACMNHWKEIFNDQIDTILHSNIINDLHMIYISLLYNDYDDVSFIEKKIIGYDKFKIVYKSKNLNEYEFPALRLIKNIAIGGDCNICYIHTKGVSINENNMSFYHGSNDINHLKNCVNDWRKYMEYFILDNYKNCIDQLNIYDACGVNLVESPQKHFSGNFWWANSSYIKKLPDIHKIDISHRWNAEFWLGHSNGNFKNLYTTNAGYIENIKDNYKKFFNEI